MSRFAQVTEDLDKRILPKLQSKGEELMEEGTVWLEKYQEGLIVGAVTDDTRRFKAKIWWDDISQGFSCACGTAPTRPCEHVWAILAEADERGYFPDAADVFMSGLNQLLAQPAARNDKPAAQSKSSKKASLKEPAWKKTLERFGEAAEWRSPEPTYGGRAAETWPASRQVCYVIDQAGTMLGKGLVIEVAQRDRKLNGEWAKPKAMKVRSSQIALLPDERDRLILSMLTGGQTGAYGYDYYYGHGESSSYRLGDALAKAAVSAIGRTERSFFRLASGVLHPLTWGTDEAWNFSLQINREDVKDQYVVSGMLARGDERRPIVSPAMLTMGGLVFWSAPPVADASMTVELLNDGGAFGWISFLRQSGELRVPTSASAELLRELHRPKGGARPPLELPEELNLVEERPPVIPTLALKAAKKSPYGYSTNENRLLAEVTFDYGDTVLGKVPDGTDSKPLVDMPNKRVLMRDDSAEAHAMARLYELGFRMAFDFQEKKERLGLTPSKLAKVVQTLVREGWKVEAEGKLYRQPGEFKLEVTSGIDWFELHGNVAFGDQTVALPKLLAALRKGETMIQLGDGTLGMLPQEWLKKYGVLAGMGKEKEGHIEYAKTQVGLLDALLAARPEATWDAAFEKTRQTLRHFEGVIAEEPPAEFKGELRPYQKQALGWMRFLREFSFGGCLADDMGLGKTVQVLAMLAGRKSERSQKPSESSEKRVASSEKKSEVRSQNAEAHRPTLIVVPRSLVFNWMQESARFAPDLKVLDHSHAARTKATEQFAGYDIVLTTYGTLLRDVTYLKDAEFDYLILDEAHAIKNGASESAKASRLLTAHHRLALSGTPVQNHMGELWSLFDFLNPGMLGSASIFSGAAAAGRTMDEENRTILAKAIRPFLLRRTKEQVAKELPAKLEQTIFCELNSEQRKQYDELKEFYRQNLIKTIAEQGMNKAKIQILEALLRLRQAACHPGLIDKTRVEESSAKLDTLLDRLEEVVQEGHKALVFSQFTSFLAIVKKALDKRKVKYEYLDGKTKDRQARVEHFQNTDKLKVFLISLKAGGVGLNLTSADYVFLLDPWWNPAIEAQAIDRTHRIGQTRQVFACRLIAKGTVEEKVLELQKSKRELADAIIGEENSLIGGLKREDLELLLS